jgi:hypothetical protein
MKPWAVANRVIACSWYLAEDRVIDEDLMLGLSGHAWRRSAVKRTGCCLSERMVKWPAFKTQVVVCVVKFIANHWKFGCVIRPPQAHAWHLVLKNIHFLKCCANSENPSFAT